MQESNQRIENSLENYQNHKAARRKGRDRHPLSTKTPCPPPKSEGNWPGSTTQKASPQVPSPSYISPHSSFCCHSRPLWEEGFAAVTVPPESFFGTPNTSSPCTHPLISWHKRSIDKWQLMPPTRAHHWHWDVCDLKKSPHTAETREKRRTPPSDHSGLDLKGGAQPSFQPSDFFQRQQKSKDSNRPTQTQKKGNDPQKNHSLSDLLSKLQPVAHTPDFLLFPLTTSLLLHCHNPSTVKGPLGSGHPATKPHAFPGTAYPGSVAAQKPPLPAPNPARKVCHDAPSFPRLPSSADSSTAPGPVPSNSRSDTAGTN